MVYIIGDSHVSVFSGINRIRENVTHIQPEFGTQYTLSKGNLVNEINKFEQRIAYFYPIKIGSNTAYNSYNKIPIILQVIKEYNIKNTDFIFICFGEIDIRNHIGFHAEKQNISLTTAIKICVDRYMQTILFLKNIHNNIGVYAPPPSSVWEGSVIKGWGDVYLRNKMTLEFSEYLKECCVNNDIIFKDIAKKMILSDGSTDEKIYMIDFLHLSQNAMPLIIEEFKDIIDLYGTR